MPGTKKTLQTDLAFQELRKMYEPKNRLLFQGGRKHCEVRKRRGIGDDPEYTEVSRAVGT